MNRSEVPSPDEVRQRLTIPLLDQLQIDTGDVIHQLSCGRLGIDGPPQSVRQQSKQMGVTRARVYQLLEDCARVMDVRWPNGKTQLARLCHKFQTEAPPDADLKLLLATVELFYPGKRGLVDDEPAEQLVHA